MERFQRLLSVLSYFFRIFWKHLLLGQEMNILNQPISGDSNPQVAATAVAASLQKMILKY